MPAQTRSFLVVIALTLAAAGLVAAVDRVEPIRNERLFEFPLSIGEWTGRDIPMSDYVYKGIETPYLILRDYRSQRSGRQVNLSIVWFDDTNIAFHAPEACLGGISEEVKAEGTVRLRLDREHEMKKFVTNLGGTDYLVIYFFDVDGYITTSQSGIRWRVLLKRLRFGRASASFVRVMAPVDVSEQEITELLAGFLKEIHPLLKEYTSTDRVLQAR